MKSSELKHLQEQAARRSLTSEECSRLRHFLEANPAAWPDWREDMALTRCLATMPDAPLASNFSTRVMNAIELEDRRHRAEATRPWLIWRPPVWLTRLAMVSGLAILATMVWVRGQQNHESELAELAESVATISEVASIPSVDILKDFDAVQTLGAVPPAADVEADLVLLTALE